MSGTDFFQPEKQSMTIGETLRARREQLGWSLEEVSQKLRIRLGFLQALEDNQVDKLPGVVYASGFLRAYAELLNLDVKETIERFRSENHQVNRKTELMFPAPVLQGGVPAGVIVLFSGLIIIGAYIGWYKMTDHQEMSSQIIPPVVTENKKIPQAIEPSPQIASIMPLDRPSTPPLPAGEQINPSVKDDSSGEESADLQENTSFPLRSENSSTQSSAEQENTAFSETGVDQKQLNLDSGSNQPASVDDQEQIVIKAIAPSWIRVHQDKGQILYEHILKAGESWTLPLEVKDAVIQVGNAGGIVIDWKGKESPPLGRKGRGIRKFVLSQQNLKQLFAQESKATNSTSNFSPMNTTNPLSSPTLPIEKPSKKSVAKRPFILSPHQEISADELNAQQLKR